MTDQSVIKGNNKTKKKILQAALTVFSEKGYHSTTVQEIAQRANIAKGTVYLYFPTKQDLFTSLLNFAFLLIGQAVRAKNRGVLDARQRLQNILEVTLALFLERKLLFRLILQQIFSWGERGEEVTREWRQRTIQLLSSEIHSYRPQTTPENVVLTARSVFAFLLAVFLGFITRDLQLEEDAIRERLSAIYQALIEEGLK